MSSSVGRLASTSMPQARVESFAPVVWQGAQLTMGKAGAVFAGRWSR